MKISYLFCLISVGLSGALIAPPMNAQTLPFQNPSLSHQERAKDLLGRLTLEEKASKNSSGGVRLCMVQPIWAM